MIGIFEYLKNLGLTRVPGNPLYLKQVRTRRCLICGSTQGVEAHHEGPHGLGKKTPDFFAVPLCHKCHMDRHAGRAPERFETVVYVEQVQSLLREVEMVAPLLPAPVGGVCGGCGGDLGRVWKIPGVPACASCVKQFKLKAQRFASSGGLADWGAPSEDEKYFRQLQVLVLVASAVRRKGT